MNFGERLSLERRRRHLKQEEVANAAGISRRTYAIYEKSENPPKSEQRVEDLANAIGCKKDNLLKDTFDLASIVSIGTAGIALGTGNFPMTIGLLAGLLGQKAALKKLRSEKVIEDSSLSESTEETEEDKQQRVFRKKAHGLIISALSEKNYTWNRSEPKNALPDVPIVSVDLTGEKINNWWFCCYSYDETKDTDLESPKAVAQILLMRFVMIPCDETRKISFVTDSNVLFQAFESLRENNSYRGNMSVILVNMEEMEVIQETEIAIFNEVNNDLPSLV